MIHHSVSKMLEIVHNVQADAFISLVLSQRFQFTTREEQNRTEDPLRLRSSALIYIRVSEEVFILFLVPRQTCYVIIMLRLHGHSQSYFLL